MKNCTPLQKSKIKKRHFQLLEIMVAMFLILLCAAPALQIYTNMYKQQTKIMYDYEADHLANLVHAKIVEAIYKNTLSFEDLLNSTPRSVEDGVFSKQLKEIGYKCQFTINRICQRKMKKEGFVRYLFEITVTLQNLQDTKNNKVYSWDHYVQGPSIQGELLEEENSDDNTEDASIMPNEMPPNGNHTAQTSSTTSPNGGGRQ